MNIIKGYAPAQDAQIYYEEAGNGKPLVLIHSLLFDTRVWDDVFGLFAAKYRTIRYDIRGFGRTSTENREVSNEKDLLALFDHLAIKHAFVLGLSVGGEIAFDFSFKHPEKVTALVVSGGGQIGWESSPEAEKKEQDFNAAGLAGNYSLALDIFSDLWIDGPVSPAEPIIRQRTREIMEGYTWGRWKDAAAKQAALKQTEDSSKPEKIQKETVAPEETPDEAEYYRVIKEKLASFSVPTLLIAGERDQPGVILSAKATAAAMPNSEIALIKGAAHIIPMEKPQEFARVVCDFLAKQG